MRRFLTLVCLLCLALPAGISISGCTRNPGENYCNGLGYGEKITDLDHITLSPTLTGISLAYGQTQYVTTPSALTCKDAAASVNSANYSYGTTNNKLVDISPTGDICAGTWNRNTGGGISDYTTCSAPDPLPSTNGLPYSAAYITASYGSVTSNSVEVHVHAAVTSVSLVGPSECQSQTTVSTLDAQACYSSGGTQYLLCKPTTLTDSSQFACSLPTGVDASAIPACSASIGTFTYSVGTSTIGTIDSDNNTITAAQPGTTVITAAIAGSGSSAGYFSTCPPKTISVVLANGGTSGTVTKGATQNLTTVITDTNGNTITGLSLDYQSTNPIDLSVTSAGAITSKYPGVADVNAVCQPSTCNPAPINKLGFNGTGLSVSSNSVTITTPGTASEYVWFAAPGQSQYFVPIQLLTGSSASNVRLPYVPNSMKMDALGTDLYFGSTHELMIYSTTTNALQKADSSVPGVVLAVSPDNSQVLINDQLQHYLYIYNVSAASTVKYGGMANAAAWTPDGKTLYITDNANLNTPSSCGSGTDLLINGHTDTLYVYNANTGLTTYSLPASPLQSGSIPSCTTEANTALPGPDQTPAITIPGIGAYLRGLSTQAHTWCPSGIVGNSSNLLLYPEVDSVAVQSDTLATTPDGGHVLGVATLGSGVTLYDIGVTIPTTTVNSIALPDACTVTTTGSGTSAVQTVSPLDIASTVSTVPLTKISSSAIVNDVVTSPVSDLAFITYNASDSGALLPYYVPSTGVANYLTLTGSSAITAPLAGAFSPDNSLFFVSTAGDNKIHYLDVSKVLADPDNADTQQLSPALPACTPVSSGGSDVGCVYSGSDTIVPATVITVVPRTTT